MEEINNIMLIEHGKIRSIIIEIKGLNKIHKEKLIGLLSALKDLLEKHFITEEKVIFSSMLTSKDTDIIFKLMKDHSNILQEFKNIDSNNGPLQLDYLLNILEDHTDFEDISFYPRLNDLLSTSEKEEIIKRYYEHI